VAVIENEFGEVGVEYPFEWAGVFQASDDLRMVLGDGPDPTMSVVVIPGGALSGDDFKETAERVLRLFARKGDPIGPGGRIEVGEKQYTLDLAGRGAKSFTIGVPRSGRYAIFTQHTPEEFTLRIEDTRGKRLEPLAAKAFACGAGARHEARRRCRCGAPDRAALREP
jgi:hypothetical protein